MKIVLALKTPREGLRDSKQSADHIQKIPVPHKATKQILWKIIQWQNCSNRNDQQKSDYINYRTEENIMLL